MKTMGLFLGCNIPLKLPDIEQSFRKALPELGIDLVDLEGASCCPSWGTLPSFDLPTWLAVSARNITLAEAKDVDVVTGCNSCFGILAETKHIIEHDEEYRKAVQEKLALINREYKGTSQVYHVLHALYKFVGPEKINEKIKYTLKQLTIAIQVGCHALWPSKVMAIKEPNPFFPTILKELCEALEADVPHYSRIEACCGMGGMRSTNMEKSLGLLKEKLISIKEEIDADMIVVGCSSCYLQMDGGQKILRDRGEIDFEIPVFYYTQLLALCMGFDPKQVAAINEIPREEIIARIQSEERLKEKQEG
ncbi:CoB--CoM heterodisulfide reductase iron-sulfur subunit B family protein [Thermodesulfatator autotrophicus]|uniref:Heterodisulfide reductase n=1 Tax=Thermodesulfatator autotrophicus TaxID=1795632 RepID=A0A177E6N1_9BACT|nr:CoB--CoM heterodisulfide reductase iron-sulfur subunit B family protein [Thermodesulfatator autotrophicus]OAG26872.1 heterodisulfide reductase [Thermodesulfatator autotrophicus]